MSRIDITISVDGNAIASQIEGIISDPTVMTEAHEKLAEIINPWIPYDTGELADEDVRIDEHCITYYAPWAEKNYYGVDIRHRTTHHPLATAFWDKVAMQTEYETLCKEFADIISRRIRENG